MCKRDASVSSPDTTGSTCLASPWSRARLPRQQTARRHCNGRIGFDIAWECKHYVHVIRLLHRRGIFQRRYWIRVCYIPATSPPLHCVAHILCRVDYGPARAPARHRVSWHLCLCAPVRRVSRARSRARCSPRHGFPVSVQHQPMESDTESSGMYLFFSVVMY